MPTKSLYPSPFKTEPDSDEPGFEIRFPDRGQADQDEERCEVVLDGEWRPIRFHDYESIFAVPGLYEQLFYEELECVSPQVVCSLLAEVAESDGRSAEPLRALDVGAGNGMVGERLMRLGADFVVGIDLLEAASAAAKRDRPGVYDDYLVCDLTELSDEQARGLRDRHFNVLTCVAALGFDDIPPAAFAAAFDLLVPGGLIAISIKERFLTEEDPSGFSAMIRGALRDGALELKAERHYRHRLSAAGEPLYYMGLVAEKRGSLRIP